MTYGLRNNCPSIMQPEHNKPIPRETETLTDQERVDEAMIESFPASDPPSWNAGLSHEPAQAIGDSLSARPAWMDDWDRVSNKLKQKFAQLTDDDLSCHEGKEDEVLTRLQKRLGMTREEIESILSKLGED